MSKNMPEIVDFGAHFESNLIYVVPRPQHAHPFLRVCSLLLHFYRFCVKIGTLLGTQKSHWRPPGGHQSSQGRLLEGTFYGPTFYMKFGSQNR